jgi:hypothetical protein
MTDKDQESVAFSKCMITYFDSIGIHAVEVLYHGSNWITIYVQELNQIEQSEKILKHQNQQIISRLLDILDDLYPDGRHRKHEWKPFSINHVYSLSEKAMTALVYSLKHTFINSIRTVLSADFQPEHIFAHSSSDRPDGHGPGYYVLFKNKKTLKRSNGPIQDQITKVAMEIFSGKEDFRENRLDLTFSHTKDPDMWGAYRED